MPSDATLESETRFAAAVAAAAAPGQSIEAIDPVRPGMSGARLFRIRLGDGRQLAAKRWPIGSEAERIREVHRVIRHARTAGCPLVPGLLQTPDGETAWNLGRSWWELAQWMPGSAAEVDAPAEVVAEGAAAIARFHQAVEPLRSPSGPPPAVRSRLVRIAELNRRLPRAFACRGRSMEQIVGGNWLAGSEDGPEVGSAPASRHDPERLRAAIGRAMELLEVRWREVAGQIGRQLQDREVPVRLQYVLRDVHREHVLFRDGIASGLVDFDALRVDTPATDLARWAASFLGIPDRGSAPRRHAVWDATLAGYRRVRPFPTEDQRLALGLLECSPLLSLANWVDWIVLENRQFPDLAAATARIEELLSVVEGGQR